MKRKKTKVNRANIILIVGIVILLIPFIFLGGILLSASSESNTPILGSRLKNERVSEITTAQLTTLEENIKKNSNVENCKIELKVATVRITVDVSDSLDADKYEALLVDLYKTVDNDLAISDYFTASGAVKEYDLEIHAYNNLDKAGQDDYIYYTLTKNSSNSNYVIDVNSTAKNEALAKELRGETTTTGTVEGEASEETTEGGE